MTKAFNAVLDEMKAHEKFSDLVIVVEPPKEELVVDKLPVVDGTNITFDEELIQRCHLIKLRKMVDEMEHVEGISETDGQYEVIYTDGKVYNGTLDQEYNYIKGTLTLPNGKIIEGEFQENFLNGEGKVVFKNGTIYTGTFKNGVLNGKGEAKFSKKNILIGDFVDGALNGQGKWIYKKNIYEGTFKNNNLVKGKHIFSNGTIYEGEFEDNELVKSNTITFPSGNKILGDINNLTEDSMVIVNRKLEEWSPEEVLYWIRCHYAKYYSTFRDSFHSLKIDGYLFKNLIEKDYDSLEIPRFHLRLLLEKRDLFFKSWW